MIELNIEQTNFVSGACPPCIYVAAFYVGGFIFSAGVAVGIAENS